MHILVATVMDRRLRDLLALWHNAAQAAQDGSDLVDLFADHADHLLVIERDGSNNRYVYYGQSFIEHFGTDLTGSVLDILPTEILPADRRGMLDFEYTFVRQVHRPLWRSYTALFGDGQPHTWQRLVLPCGERLVVGAYPQPEPPPAARTDPGEALLRLVIERVPLVVDGFGQIQDLGLSLKAFSETRLHLAKLEVLATRDPLTGVANLRHFHHLASLELEHARRMGRSLSVLALDIDHFKRINDGWGHAAGDAALKAFAGACRAALREPDILGRCGGEEFAVILPNTGAHGASVTAERVRQQVEQLQVELDTGDVLRFTVSIGIATADAMEVLLASPTVATLLARADAALYRSKAEGRNRVTVAAGNGAAVG